MQYNQSKSFTVRKWQELRQVSGYIVMGNFDGVHRAHINLIKEVADKGKVNVLTYSPHPALALKRVNSPFLLTTDEEKYSILQKLAVDEILFLDFDEDMAGMEPEDFVKDIIVGRLNPQGIAIGYDHHFGKERRGDANFLKEMGERYGFEVIVYPEFRMDGESVKSTVIREFIHEGEMNLVRKLLGHPYPMTGEVVEGSGLGRRIGYPTANLKISSDFKLIPPDGVYSSIAYLENNEFPAMLYIGSSPTFGIEERKIELHLLDFSKSIYGKKIRCDVYSFIRGEMDFESERVLKKSIERNKQEVLENLKEVNKWEFQQKEKKR